MPPRTAPEDLDLPLVLTTLMKGVLYRDTHDKAWNHLQQLTPRVRDHMGLMGLMVIVDEAEGYAFLRSLPDPEDGERQIPRLIARRSLPFNTSLMLALLRKKLAEFDSANDETRLIISREDIAALVQTFMPTNTNEARIRDQIDATTVKVVELGFLRRIPKQDGMFEVRRVIKAYVDGQWLHDFDQRLAEYAHELAAPGE